jgi:hypothetical protein
MKEKLIEEKEKECQRVRRSRALPISMPCILNNQPNPYTWVQHMFLRSL